MRQIGPWRLDVYNRLARTVTYGNGHAQTVYEINPVDRRIVT